MIRNVGILIAAAVALWAALAALLYLIWEPVFAGSGLTYGVALGQSVTALLLCLVPAALTMLWAAWGRTQAPEQQVAAVLGGTGVRMFFVLGVALLLNSSVRYCQLPGFWLWVLLFYLFTLTLEVVLLVRGGPAASAGK